MWSASRSRPTAASLRAAPSSAQRPSASGRRLGLTVALENHPQGLLADAASIRRFIGEEEFADVGVIYDVANAVAIGEDPVEGLAILARHLSVVHLSDSPLGQWRHDPIGGGEIDFRAIREALRRQGYGGAVALEILSEAPLADLVDGARRLAAMGWVFEEPLPKL
jgi:deoxyribonuclease-4